jgi:hypothetical protein
MSKAIMSIHFIKIKLMDGPNFWFFACYYMDLVRNGIMGQNATLKESKVGYYVDLERN